MTRIGITIANEKNKIENDILFNNGINQNILFLYKLFEKQGYDVYFLSNNVILNSKYKYFDIYDQNKLNSLDYFITIGLELNKDMIIGMKESNVTLISMHLGNSTAAHSDFILHNIDNNITLQNNLYYDKIWISPHFEYSIDYYKYIHQNDHVKVAPFIWEPAFLDEYNGTFDKNNISIGIFEPNLHLNKSSFIPMIICDKAKEYIKKTFVFYSDQLKDNKLFLDFANKSDLVKDGRMTCEGRHKFVPMMNKYCNVVVSFNQDWGLNYLLLECLYLGIPLIHNSPFFKEYGYYYEGYDASGASKHIEDLYKNGFNREEYIEKNKEILYKYSPENPENIHFFVNEIPKKNKIEIKENNFVISLTTLPSRLSYLEDCLESLLNQEYENYEIHINIPIHNKIEGSFKKKLTSINDKIKFFYVEDIGSITRLYYTLHRITDNNQYIILVDDNCKYNSTMLQTYNIKINEHSNSAIGFSGLRLNGDKISNVDISTDVDILENSNSICYSRKFFNDDFFMKILNNNIDWCPKEVIHEDDIVISRYLTSKNIKLKVVSSKVKETDPLILMYPITKINKHTSGLHHFRNEYGSKIDSILKIKNDIKIPKNIFQTWKTKELPNNKTKKFTEELKKHNPEFNYHFYTDDDIVHFIETHYPEYKHTFDNFKYNIQKIDFFRLLVVYHYGGFYFDIDVNITKNLSDLCNYSCVFPQEYTNHLNISFLKTKNINNLIGNYGFGAYPKHPFIKYCIENIINPKYTKEEINKIIDKHTINTTKEQRYIFFTTGPDFITDCYAEYKDKKEITILVEDTGKRFCFGNYGYHIMIGSWKEDDISEKKITKYDKYRNIGLSYLNQIQKIPIPYFAIESPLCSIFIDNREDPFFEFIIRYFIINLDITFSHYVVCSNNNYTFMKKLCNKISSNIHIIKLPNSLPIHDRTNYSNTLKNIEFWNLFDSKKCLLYQSDTFIFNKHILYSFLQYDYVGAPWPRNVKNWPHVKYNMFVGNGGLSFRNIECIKEICKTEKYSNEVEDVFLCKNMYDLQKKIPNDKEASKFSVENIKYQEIENIFGGHQFWLCIKDWENVVIEYIKKTLISFSLENNVLI